jgi:hypothetical protein
VTQYQFKGESQFTQDDDYDEDILQIQKNIEREYQRKLKEVNDEAMLKLQRLKLEHQQKLETSYQDWERRSAIRRSESRGSIYSSGSGAQKRPGSTSSRISSYSNLSFVPQT